jgi:hypothetical protein
VLAVAAPQWRSEKRLGHPPSSLLYLQLFSIPRHSAGSEKNENMWSEWAHVSKHII